MRPCVRMVTYMVISWHHVCMRVSADLHLYQVEVLIETHRLDVRQAIYKLDMIKNQVGSES
jgi:hypothetical protein